MTIEGVDWNADLLIRLISEGLSKQSFIEQGLKEGKYKNFSEADRVKLLTMVYDKISFGRFGESF